MSRISKAAGGAILLLVLGAAVALAAHRTITRANAQAVAAAVNLRHGDLPALKQQANPITARDRRLSAQLAACVGETPSSTMLADVQSPAFAGPPPISVTVASDTQIVPSASFVAVDFAAIRRPRALTCIRTGFLNAVNGTLAPNETVTASAARLARVVSGSDVAFAVRVTLLIHLKNGANTASVPVYEDAIGFAVGQAEVTLNVSATSSAPTQTFETNLAQVLVARARAAIG